MFSGLASANSQKLTGGLVRARGGNLGTLSLAAIDGQGNETGYYELDAKLSLKKVEDETLHIYTKMNTAIPQDVLAADDASVIYTDDKGHRWRLPRGENVGPRSQAPESQAWSATRVAREVATERDLFNAHGTFYELPAENAGGFAKARAVATHNRLIHDFCSFRGLFVMTGIDDMASESPHLIRSDDGKAAVWVGAIDDVWKLGKPRGFGGPWKDSKVLANSPSDPYLLTGFDKKTLSLSHLSESPISVRVELDVTGDGDWKAYKTFRLSKGESTLYEFPPYVTAYWLRLVSDQDAIATGQLLFE